MFVSTQCHSVLQSRIGKLNSLFFTKYLFTIQEQPVESASLSASAAAAIEAVAGAAFKALAYRTSKRSVGDRHLAWQLAQHILLRSILSVSFPNDDAL